MSRVRTNKHLYIALIFILSFIFYPRVMAQDLNMQSPFGVLEFLNWNHPWNSYKYSCKEDFDRAVELMKEAGVGWVRMDFLWTDIEPTQGQFEFGRYDDIVNLLYRNNINILGLLNYSTDWASPRGKWNCPSTDTKFFVNYAAKVIQRYKDKIKYWEVWNEPDSHIYWMNQDGLKTYCALLRDVYIAAKKIDPDCKILNGGFASGLISVNRIYDNGAKDYFDILNIHIFESPLNPSGINKVVAYPKLAYKTMRRNGDGHKKIWVTEIGCPGLMNGLRVDKWWMDDNPSERKQAEWLKDVFTELIKIKFVEKIFWAFFRDCKKHWDNGIDYFGLVRWNFSRKPAFFSYQECFNNWKKSNK